MRFCMITTFYPPYNFGGDAVYVHTLANELARRGHHVEVIHCKDAYRFLARRNPTRPYDDHPNVVVHGLESRWGALSPLATQQTGSPLFKQRRIHEILRQGFDVIHYHNISLVGGPKILEYGNAIKLYTLHEYWLICPMHVLFRNNKEICQKPTCLTCTLRHGRPPQLWRYSRMIQQSAAHVDRFLAPSRFCMEMHRARGFDWPMEHLPYFAPPIDQQTTAQDAGSTAETSNVALGYFLYAGRLEKLKGVQTLIPLFRKHPHLRLVIAGRGDMEAELRSLAGDAPNIQFAGFVHGAALQTLYRNATALLVPSICYDVAPLVMLEASQQRTPVIGRRIGGVPELIENGDGGLVYDDDETLLHHLERLAANRDLRDRLGANAFAAYQRNYTPDAFLARYFTLIEGLKREPRPSIPGLERVAQAQ
jgi:glycosyltransferase involved in cell wall biosynthesis